MSENNAVKCIFCEQKEPSAKSHVISKFLRNRLCKDDKGLYKFNWLEGVDRNNHQDLPKPNLMCTECDNNFGGKIEGKVPKIIMPEGDVSQPAAWESKLFAVVPVAKLKSGIINVAEYVIHDEIEKAILKKFTVLTAWRALHAMKKDNHHDVVSFLDSISGKKLNADTISFLNSDEPSILSQYKYQSKIYLTGLNIPGVLTGECDDLPFAWAFLKLGTQTGVAVSFGFWTIIWSIDAANSNLDPFDDLHELCFIYWHADLMKKYRGSKKNNAK